MGTGEGWTTWGVATIGVGLVLLVASSLLHARRLKQDQIILYCIALAAFGGAVGWLAWNPSSASMFRNIRSVNLSSGAAPNLALCFLFLSLAWWAWTNAQRIVIATERYQTIPSPKQRSLAVEILGVFESFQHLYFRAYTISWRTRWMPLLILFAAAVAIALGRVNSLEGTVFDAVLSLLLALVCSLFVSTMFNLLAIWRRFRRILEALELLPIRHAFTPLGRECSWAPVWQHSPRRKSYVILIRSIECARRLRATMRQGFPEQEMDRLEAAVGPMQNHIRSGTRIPFNVYDRVQVAMKDVTQQVAIQWDASDWKRDYSVTLDDPANETKSSGWKGWITGIFGKTVRLEARPAADEDQWKAAAAELIALRYMAFIRYIMIQMRTLVSQISTGFILVVIGMNCYPFQPENTIRWMITLLFAVLGIPILLMLFEMDHDAILSRINNSAPGKVDSEFWLRTAQIGALPLIAVLSSHFPSLGRSLFAWVQPVLSALH
jgi:hypothetical protein